MKSGSIKAEAVTSKDLMIQPNPPRFLREGDEIEFTVKVINQSDNKQSGKVSLNFSDATTLVNVDATIKNSLIDQSFEIPAKQSQTFSWRISIPDGQSFLHYKAIASSEKFSDGEEGMLPILSRKILVTESITMPIRDSGSKKFSMIRLLESTKSPSLKDQNLNLQVLSHPIWSAVMSLPYLMEFPHECSEQTFNRFYGNLVAQYVATSDPKIRDVFDSWKNEPSTLQSPLAKNQELKSVLIEETPWLRDMTSETEARHNIGLLFDETKLRNESAQNLKKLSNMQLANGAWPWFSGGEANFYLTIYIATGFGKLKHMNIDIDYSAAYRAIDFLDHELVRIYQENQKNKNESYDAPIAMYLYGRSFYLKEKPLEGDNKTAWDFFVNIAKRRSLEGSRMTQAHTAIALSRIGETDMPNQIITSLRERATMNAEMGMFWQDSESNSFYWYQASIETQAAMIELFQEVAKDQKAVSDCQAWLLTQKQTKSWSTTKSTADAIYSLLLDDTDKLFSANDVSVNLGGKEIAPNKIETDTGFQETKFYANEIKPEMGNITVTKKDQGASWVSLNWQYLENISNITSNKNTPLEVRKTLWVKRVKNSSIILEPISKPLQIGDEIVSRLEIRADRDMEFIHLKDQHGSGLEPTNVLSSYRYQNNIGYYEVTRDTASHFFIDRLPKGTYVFESSSKVQLRGIYQTGIAELQSMYAPEFNSHSDSTTLEVK
jgi:uncharacterized protein YfaS (alpha-2-macroglobulin family)